MNIRLLFLTICVFSLSQHTGAQDFKLISNQATNILIKHELQEKPFVNITLNANDHIDFSKNFAITTMESGAPQLPVFSESVIIPSKGEVELAYEFDSYQDFPNVNITPSKGNIKRNVNPSDVPYTFGEVYSTNAFYPSQPVELSDPFVIRQTRGVTVRVYPYQYNPVTKTLRVYKNLKIIVNTNNAAGFQSVKQEKSTTFRSVLSNLFLNGEEEVTKYTPKEEQGEMLIVTTSNYTSAIQPFVEWKTRKGIKTTVVTTDITGTTDTDIKDYISNFYSNNADLTFVLLVGDHAQVPCHTYGMSGSEQLWSDSYYGMLTGGANDYYPEVFVGRFSGNVTNVTTMVARTLEYEQDPMGGDWMTNAIGLGSDEGGGFGDDGEADWQHLRNIRTKLLGYGYNEVYEFYDGSRGGNDASGNPSSSIILPAVNSGVGLFNYTGHGDLNIFVSGNFTSSHINSATNNGKYPFVISVACNNGTFTAGTCLSESWMNATNNGSPSGAVAVCGSSILMAWTPPMQTQDEMTEIIAESYANNRKATLGGIFYNAQMSMLEQYGNGSAREVMQTWVMFGDPSTEFRNKITQNMNTSHVGWMQQSATSLIVNCDVEGATVAISQDGEILGTTLVSGGVANFSGLNLLTNSPLYVTSTKQNYKPYQGFVVIGDGTVALESLEVSNLKIYPNPANDMITVKFDAVSSFSSIEILDLNGKLLNTVNVNVSGIIQEQISLESLNQGIYILKVINGDKISTERIIKN